MAHDSGAGVFAEVLRLASQGEAEGGTLDASAAVSRLSTQDLEEVRKMHNPPVVVRRTLEATFLLLNAAKGDLQVLPPTWTRVQKMLSSATFLPRMQAYDATSLRDAPTLTAYVAAEYFVGTGRPRPSAEKRSRGSIVRRQSVSYGDDLTGGGGGIVRSTSAAGASLTAGFSASAPSRIRTRASTIASLPTAAGSGLRRTATASSLRDSVQVDEPLTFQRVSRASQAVGALFRWCAAALAEALNPTPEEDLSTLRHSILGAEGREVEGELEELPTDLESSLSRPSTDDSVVLGSRQGDRRRASFADAEQLRGRRQPQLAPLPAPQPKQKRPEAPAQRRRAPLRLEPQRQADEQLVLEEQQQQQQQQQLQETQQVQCEEDTGSEPRSPQGPLQARLELQGHEHQSQQSPSGASSPSTAAAAAAGAAAVAAGSPAAPGSPAARAAAASRAEAEGRGAGAASSEQGTAGSGGDAQRAQDGQSGAISSSEQMPSLARAPAGATLGAGAGTIAGAAHRAAADDVAGGWRGQGSTAAGAGGGVGAAKDRRPDRHFENSVAFVHGSGRLLEEGEAALQTLAATISMREALRVELVSNPAWIESGATAEARLRTVEQFLADEGLSCTVSSETRTASDDEEPGVVCQVHVDRDPQLRDFLLGVADARVRDGTRSVAEWLEENFRTCRH